jgi:hypothetical protein
MISRFENPSKISPYYSESVSVYYHRSDPPRAEHPGTPVKGDYPLQRSYYHSPYKARLQYPEARVRQPASYYYGHKSPLDKLNKTAVSFHAQSSRCKREYRSPEPLFHKTAHGSFYSDRQDKMNNTSQNFTLKDSNRSPAVLRPEKKGLRNNPSNSKVLVA